VSISSQETDVIIIAGHLKVAAAQRQAFVDAHADLVAQARRFPGCLDLAITADSVDATRINNMELWRSEADLEAWRKVCKPPKIDVRIESDSVRKHHISHSGPPF